MIAPEKIRKRHRRPNARPGEILEAALDLFSERGFAAARLEDIASRAGLSKASIYLYYKDKNRLLNAIVEAMAVTNVLSVAAMADSHQGPMMPLLRGILQHLGQRLAQGRLPDLIKLIISESRAHPDLGRLYLDRVVNRALPLFRKLIERGVASGEFRPVDADLAARCLVGPMLLTAVWKSVFEPIGAEPLDSEALARQHADILANGLLA